MKNAKLIQAALATTLTVATAAASAETLNYAFFAPAGSFPGVQMQEWAKQVEERTDGEVTVNTYPGGTLLTANNMYDGILSGVADIGLSVTSYEPGRFSLINLTNTLTGVEISSEELSLITYDLIQEFADEEPGLEDYKVITAFSTEPVRIHVESDADSVSGTLGARLRAPGDVAPFLDTLGYETVGMSQAEAAEALQIGLVDGFVSSRESLLDFQYARYINTMIDYPITNAILLALMPKERWESLSPETRDVIDELGREMAQFAGNYLDDHVQESVAWAEEEHDMRTLQLTDEERAEWDRSNEEVRNGIIQDVADQGLPAERYMERFQEMLDERM